MTKKFKTLLYEVEGAVAKVTLNRPEIHNAFDDQMILELTEVFSGLGSDSSSRVVMLTGKGKSFCAGADLHWMKKMASYSREENIQDALQLHGMLQTIQDCPKPVLAKVNGAALGGGVGLLAVSDLAYSVEEARFGFTEVRLGLIPAVISPFVLSKIGLGKAREYFLTGETFTAAVAKDMGLIQGWGSPEVIEGILADKVSSLKKAGPQALAECKKMILELGGYPSDQIKNNTAEKIARVRASEEGREGMEAFLNKQKPPWSRK